MGKRITAFLLALLLLVGACGSQADKDPATAAQPTAAVQTGDLEEIRWKLEETKLPDADEALTAVLSEGCDACFALAHDMSGESIYRFVIMSEDLSADGAQLGICIQKLAAPYTEWENYPVFWKEAVGDDYVMQSIAMCADGSICMLVSKPEEQGSAYRLTWTQENGVETEIVSSSYFDNNFWKDINTESYVDEATTPIL